MITSVNQNCYRAHCVATTRAIAARLGLGEKDYTIGFQSRLGRAAWVGPQTEDLLKELPGRGVKRLAVCCPSFVADCLETLEEIGERGREVRERLVRVGRNKRRVFTTKTTKSAKGLSKPDA